MLKTEQMSEKRSNTKTLQDSSYDKDFGKCVLDTLFHGWYSIHFYKPDASIEQILARKLSILNRELLYLHDQLDVNTTNPPREGDSRTYLKKFNDANALEAQKKSLIDKLKTLNKQNRNQRPSTS